MLTGPAFISPLFRLTLPLQASKTTRFPLADGQSGHRTLRREALPAQVPPDSSCRKMHIRCHVEGGCIRGMNTSASKPPGRPQGGVRTPSASRRAPGGIHGRPEPFARRADGWTKPEVDAGFDAMSLSISAAVKGPLGDGETHMKQDSLDKRNGLLQENRLTHFIRVAGSHPVDIPGPVRLSWRFSR